jgi:hypothetical protein
MFGGTVSQLYEEDLVVLERRFGCTDDVVETNGVVILSHSPHAAL